MRNSEDDPHFIGWLPMPRRFSRFLVPVALSLVVAMGLAAVLIANGQRSPGSGRWDDETPVTFVGVVSAEPYAMLRVRDHSTGEIVTILLVEEGKHGAKARVQALDGQTVQVTGTLLHRDGRRMLELLAGDAGLQRAELATQLPNKTVQHLGKVSLVGEIIDPKCFLGAMKPGNGTTHKGCAILCLKGGVPPMFVTQNADSTITYHLLVNAAGGPLDPSTFNKVGDVIRLKGELERWDDLFVLKV